MQQLGKYQLIRKLATGGMAEVFLAKAAGPMGFEKTLVVKRILPHLAEDPAFVEMFLSEAKLAAQLNHPHIVQIFDFGEADGEYFLAMEYIDGPNLRVLLKRAQTAGLELPPAVCARLIASACEGLAFAHDFADPETGEPIGLIHRDISPDNILVSRQGAVKVVDFGIAKSASQGHKTQSGVIKGKLAYMPPEQIRAKALDRRVDVYALGVVLYELVTGCKPFESETDASTMQAILFEPMVPAAQHRPDLSEPLLRILDRALAKDREQRYPDCLALAADLEEFILSVGKPVTTQHIVQLIAQVSPSSDSPMPTPHGTPRGGSGPRSSATPAHTPVPATGGGTGPRSSGSGLRSSTKSAPLDPTLLKGQQAPAQPLSEPEPIVVERTQQLETPDAAPSKKAPPPEASPGKRMAIPAALVAVLLLGGGGYWLSRSGPTPPPVTPPIVADTPPVKEAPPTPKPEELAQTPTPETPPENTPPPETQPPEVATAPETPTPESEPTTPKTQTPKTRTGSKTAKSGGKGTLAFRVRPFATIFINGKNYGQTPFDAVELPSGTYTVKFVNEELKKTKIQQVELKPGENKIVKLNLEE
ncbi:serine/threonine-protein kinase [Hyalangium minutum]|uniref:Serine/threonine protein kinase Pkn6 n=1 Tax=Hyalangium minutum TaxID=394096 RepID=A0A085WLK2_9BACT|nr:serine/threonine-protein kinase [Hyalangium minutum]KFE68565.1 serine/threonine protein kinase Pkn6 [Hyalangium minutum]